MQHPRVTMLHHCTEDHPTIAKRVNVAHVNTDFLRATSTTSTNGIHHEVLLMKAVFKGDTLHSATITHM